MTEMYNTAPGPEDAPEPSIPPALVTGRLVTHTVVESSTGQTLEMTAAQVDPQEALAQAAHKAVDAIEHKLDAHRQVMEAEGDWRLSNAVVNRPQATPRRRLFRGFKTNAQQPSAELTVHESEAMLRLLHRPSGTQLLVQAKYGTDATHYVVSDMSKVPHAFGERTPGQRLVFDAGSRTLTSAQLRPYPNALLRESPIGKTPGNLHYLAHLVVGSERISAEAWQATQALRNPTLEDVLRVV